MVTMHPFQVTGFLDSIGDILSACAKAAGSLTSVGVGKLNDLINHGDALALTE